MLAILGLMGIAISALVVIDIEADDADPSMDDDGALGSATSNPAPMPLSDIVFADELAEASDTASQMSGAFDNGDLLSIGAASDFGVGDDETAAFAGFEPQQPIIEDTEEEFIPFEDADLLLDDLGDKTIVGDDDHNMLQGSSGDDHITGNAGDDVIDGLDGDDTMISGEGSDVMFGGAGDDLLDGRDDGGMDYLDGSDGNDRLVGGAGDHMNGGQGEDVFVMHTDASGQIDDFSNTDDMIEVTYIGDTPPTLSTEQTDNGLLLLADGQVVTVLAGLDDLDLGRVSVIPA